MSGKTGHRGLDEQEQDGAARAPILIVDDSGYARQRLRRFLKAEGWDRVAEAADGEEALDRYREKRPELVLIDQVMRGRPGIETARALLRRDPQARIVMFTAVSDPEVHRRALEAGIQRVLCKNDWKGLQDVLAPERG